MKKWFEEDHPHAGSWHIADYVHVGCCGRKMMGRVLTEGSKNSEKILGMIPGVLTIPFFICLIDSITG